MSAFVRMPGTGMLPKKDSRKRNEVTRAHENPREHEMQAFPTGTYLRAGLKPVISGACLAIGVLASAFWPGSAGAAPEQAGSAEVSAMDLLKRSSEVLSKAPYLACDAEVITTHTHDEDTTRDRAQYNFARGPNGRFLMIMTLPDEQLRVAVDGERMTICLASTNECVIEKPPKRLGTFVGWLTQEPSFRRIFSDEILSEWTERVLYSTVSNDTIDGVSCDRVSLTFDRTELHIWLKRDGEPVPIKLFADMSRGARHSPGTYTTEIRWSEWRVGEKLADSQFDTTIPAEMKTVDWFSSPEGDQAPRIHALETLLGAQAPPFKLALMGGGELELSNLKGSCVVVLDFWATWCRPCRSTLEELDEIAKTYGDKNVICVAVNVLEPEELIKDFRDAHHLESLIGMDKEGDVAAAFGVEAIPCTIVIGLEGTIQSIDVGPGRWYGRTLSKTLDRIIAGDEVVESTARFSASERLRYRLQLEPQDFCAVFVSY